MALPFRKRRKQMQELPDPITGIIKRKDKMMLQVRSKLRELNPTSSYKDISVDDKDTTITKERPNDKISLAGSVSSPA